ncbi:type II toxin-antitoxin system VapC family toxin [Natronolimnobius sp. AArcel1]|uniref:PIN domain-containing protein n=1 Tax=Natronolimnobius sp. AArcel1 TaxID=1679093 RepID=UPI0013EB0726|nr:PIN domain-containing protein [Natronolimnobius sp. AArcel1]NGM71050.1 type II toxin-antitoxin system VapC family toxin [Natronolimnobius sp. AArcel1]
MKLLDTTFLIHYWAGREAVKDYLETHEEAEFVTTTLNIKEIAVGRELQGKLDPVEIQSQFEWMTILPFQLEHAVIAGELEAAFHRDETVNQDKINSFSGDLLIAAVAKAAGATVVTRNMDDFEQFDGVSVESY